MLGGQDDLSAFRRVAEGIADQVPHHATAPNCRASNSCGSSARAILAMVLSSFIHWCNSSNVALRARGEPVRKPPLFTLVQFEAERQPALTGARAGRARRRRACPRPTRLGPLRREQAGLICVYGNGRSREILGHGAERAAQNVTWDAAGGCAMGAYGYNWGVGVVFGEQVVGRRLSA